MTSEKSSTPDSSYMIILGYLTVIGIAILGIYSLDTGVLRSIALGLMVIFGVLFASSARFEKPILRLRAYYCIQIVIVSVLVMLQQDTIAFLMLFFVLCAQSMLNFPQREGYLWVAAISVVTVGILVAKYQLQDGILLFLPYAAGYWFFAAFSRALAAAEDSRKESQTLLSRLELAHQQLRDYADQVEELAVAEERNRLAREMHDTLGHRLTVASVQLEGAQRLISDAPDKASKMVATVREQVREALSELRSTVATLREPLQTDLSLESALTRLAAAFEGATNLKVGLNLPNEECTIPDAHRLTIYRAAQEALTNVQRHAQAGQVWMDLNWDRDHITLTVSDDGIGLSEDVDSSSFGLRGLRERATQLNGQVHIDNQPEGGARLQVVLPLSKEEIGYD
jgi:signal transduction histidine kinase